MIALDSPVLLMPRGPGFEDLVAGFCLTVIVMCLYWAARYR